MTRHADDIIERLGRPTTNGHYNVYVTHIPGLPGKWPLWWLRENRPDLLAPDTAREDDDLDRLPF